MGRRVIFLGLLAVLLLDFTEGAEKQVYLADGGKLILESPIPAEFKPLSSILWKHNRDMVVEWIEKLGIVEYYGAFHGHTTLDRKTARLEIDNLTLIYSGVYSLELNGHLQSETYMVIVIKKVPKPTVRVEPLFCSSTSSLCKLSCNGGIPEAEPISYSWRRDTGDWTESSKLMDITKNDYHVENFFCQMKNPVSEEESEPWKNVFYPEKVPKPSVALEPLSCSPSSPPCALSCNGEIPEAEPITYSWRRDTGDWTESSKLMNITKDDYYVENFFCQMKNPVSVEESEPWKNVFYEDKQQLYVTVAVGVVAAVLLVVIFAVITGQIFSLLGRFDSETGRLLHYLALLVRVMAAVPLCFWMGSAVISGKSFSSHSRFDSETDGLLEYLDLPVGMMAVVSIGSSLGFAVIKGKIFSLRSRNDSETGRFQLYLALLVGMMAVVSMGCSPGFAVITGKIFSLRSRIDGETGTFLLHIGVVAGMVATVSLFFSLGFAVITGKIFSLRSRIDGESGHQTELNQLNNGEPNQDEAGRSDGPTA